MPVNATPKRFPIGGTHLPERKALSTDQPIRAMYPSGPVVIPLRQHLGVACRALVKEGDGVTVGQLIGMNDQGLSARIHSSLSGSISALTQRKMVDGVPVLCVEVAPTPGRSAKEAALDTVCFRSGGAEDPVPEPDVVIDRVEAAGVVGMGGAAFPTHVKLRLKPECKVDSVIINGAECEPYITTDDRLMQEQAGAVFRGLEIIRCTVGAKQGFVACEINKPKAIERLIAEARRWPALEAVRLDTRYPHGAEKHLIKAVLDREVPIRQLPMAVGVVVNNVQTAIAIAAAVDFEQALIARVLTVSGSAVRSPGNFLVPIGTRVGDVIETAGGITHADRRIIIGGPMTGMETADLDLPITKSTSGIVVLRASEMADRTADVCIRCGRCVAVCPMYLQPNRITAFVNHNMIRDAEDFGLNDCILCGACAYVCPSRRPLLQWLRAGKSQSAQVERDIRHNRNAQD